ncbi:hypothetical protein QZH41_005754 [Actinostola sp. cb2023]|nr:hypothetical protein QZH41_005754 [Actinostola sp. cb2023]
MESLEAITEEDNKPNLQEIAFELDALKKEGIYNRDVQIQDLQGRFHDEKERSEKLSQLLKLEEQRNSEGDETIQSLKEKLQESDELMRDLKERLGTVKKYEDENSTLKFDDLSARIFAGEKAIKDVQKEMSLWKNRCQDMEAQLTTEQNAIDEERIQHEQVKFKLSQSEELLRSFRGETFGDNNNDVDEEDSEKYHQKIIIGLKASIDVQSERNIELHQQLQLLKKDYVETDKLMKSLQERSDKDQKLIEELNSQNEREYHKNDKLRSDIQRLKRDIDSWKKIQSDMKSQYQELRSMYDGVCKHADDQKREMLEMKLLMDRDKRSIARQRDEIDKQKVRITSFKQTYDDLKEKYDENFRLLQEKKTESRALLSQLQSAKKATGELSASNKDLKKRNDFSQKELFDRHRLLLQTEEKLNNLERVLEEKDIAVEEAKRTEREANERAERRSQEAATKEKDLMDRITLIQSLQAKIQALDDDVKIQKQNEEKLKVVIKEKENVIEDKKKEVKEKEQEQYEHEKRVIELERNTKELENCLDEAKTELKKKESETSEKEKSIESYVQQFTQKEHEILEEKNKMDNLTEEMKVMRDDYDQKSNKEMQENIDLKQRIEFEDEDLQIIEYEQKLTKKGQEIDELRLTLVEKDRVLEELKRELEESEIIQVYLNEIQDLNKVITEERSVNEQLKQNLEKIHYSGSEEALRIEEEKKEVMLQMTKELKREKQRSQSIITDLKEDLRVLEQNVENQKEGSKILSREVDLKERQMKNEQDTFLQRIEELQELLSDSKKERLQNQEKIKDLERQLTEKDRQRCSEMEEFENKSKLQMLSEKKSKLILDRQEKIEELREEVESKKELLQEVEGRLVEINKTREKEQFEVQIVIDEKDGLISSLRRENLEIRKGWERESQWMEENAMDESPQSIVDKRNEEVSDVLKDEANLLASQNIAILKIKQKIQADYNLDKPLTPTEHADEMTLDLLYEASKLSPDISSTKIEKIKTAVQKVAIVLLLSPLAYFFSCKFFLTFAAVLIPLAFIIHQKPWKNQTDQETVSNDAIHSLSMRLAAECAINDNLHQTIENLKKQCNKEENEKSSTVPFQELGRQSREEHENQKEELLRIKQKQEGDRRLLQRQQALIDKLEVILQEKEIKSRLGKFWGYEELKMAINRLKHERELEKNRCERIEDAGIQKRVAEAIKEAVSQEKRQKVGISIAVLMLSAVLILCFSVNSSSLLTVASSIIIACCSAIYGVRSWKEIEYVKNELHSEKGVVEAQNVEIQELSLLMDREHDVVSKQKQAIEALERRLNDEFKKNKDHQLTIARLTWVFQESEEVRNIAQRAKECPNATDLNPRLQKLAEDHARDKVSVFRTVVAAFLQSDKAFVACFPLAFGFGFGALKLIQSRTRKRNQETKLSVFGTTKGKQTKSSAFFF